MTVTTSETAIIVVGCDVALKLIASGSKTSIATDVGRVPSLAGTTTELSGETGGTGHPDRSKVRTKARI
jgi:hypothetical protein